jgi:hypothetical protein
VYYYRTASQIRLQIRFAIEEVRVICEQLQLSELSRVADNANQSHMETGGGRICLPANRNGGWQRKRRAAYDPD